MSWCAFREPASRAAGAPRSHLTPSGHLRRLELRAFSDADADTYVHEPEEAESTPAEEGGNGCRAAGEAHLGVALLLALVATARQRWRAGATMRSIASIAAGAAILLAAASCGGNPSTPGSPVSPPPVEVSDPCTDPGAGPLPTRICGHECECLGGCAGCAQGQGRCSKDQTSGVLVLLRCRLDSPIGGSCFEESLCPAEMQCVEDGERETAECK
jgi:hypothetical protein